MGDEKIGLEVYFTTDAGKPLQIPPVVLSPEVIQTFCRVIPQLYPRNVIFRKIHHFMVKNKLKLPKNGFSKSQS